MSVEVTGVKEVYAAIEHLIAGLESGGALDQGIETSAKEGASYASVIAPRRSGALSEAQTVLHLGNTIAIGIDPSVTNPAGQRPKVYGPIVADRTFDFYGKVVDERSNQIVTRVFEEFIQVVSR